MNIIEQQDCYVYIKDNMKNIKISKDKIKNYIIKYHLSINEAIIMYLDDNNIQEDKELTKEEQKNGKFKVEHQVDEKRPRKAREAKISVEKQELFNSLYQFVQTICDVEILTPNKLFNLKKGNLQFKLDLSQTRVKKGV